MMRALVVGASLLGITACVPMNAHLPCVPRDAVDYRGDLDAWVDNAGRVVIYAAAEDSYTRCAS